MKRADYGQASTPRETLLQRSRGLRIEAAANSAHLAVTVFALLDTLDATAATLGELRQWRRGLIDAVEPDPLPSPGPHSGEVLAAA